jgi:hypothetical protein
MGSAANAPPTDEGRAADLRRYVQKCHATRRRASKPCGVVRKVRWGGAAMRRAGSGLTARLQFSYASDDNPQGLVARFNQFEMVW